MPADRTPSVLISDPRSPLGFAVAAQFLEGGWFVIGCDPGTYPGRQTTVHICADTSRPEAAVAAVEMAVEAGNGLDFVIDLDPDSLLGDASVPYVGSVERVIFAGSVPANASVDETVSSVWARAPHELETAAQR